MRRSSRDRTSGGSAATTDTGLVMGGSTSFIAAPDHFSITGITAGPIRAGASFSATVTARNAAGNATPNHGRESWPQQAYIGWVKLQPAGSGAASGARWVCAGHKAVCSGASLRSWRSSCSMP